MPSLARSWILAGLLCCLPAIAWSGGSSDEDEADLATPLPSLPSQGYRFNSVSAAQAQCADTVWINHRLGTAFGVHAYNSPWNLEDDVSGTDSSQGWQRFAIPYRRGGIRAALDRPEWSFDYGNMANEGDANLWGARTLSGRKYIMTGVVGVWHRDDMVGVKSNISDNAEPSAVPLAGASSAWCGLRESGNRRFLDPLTGTAFNADLQRSGGDPDARSEFPGYANQWDQMMYKDFPGIPNITPGYGTVFLDIQTDLSRDIDPVSHGSGWFNPDPTTLNNFINNPADSLMIYAGSPIEGGYDTDRRWFSEVLDMNKPIQEMFATSGKLPVARADTSLYLSYGGLQPVGGLIRIVIRVKTNAVISDETTNSSYGFNTKVGAALVDDIQVNGGTLEGFDFVNSILPRSLIPDIGAQGGAWATTGRPPAAYFHIENMANLLYEDLNGIVGSPTRLCNMRGNVFVAGDKDNSDQLHVEAAQAIESPTIDLSVRSAAPGTINAQGISVSVAQRNRAMIRFDWYSGFASLDQSVFVRAGARYHAPDVVAPVSGAREWSPIHLLPAMLQSTTPQCYQMSEDISSIGVPFGAVDSLKLVLMTETIGWAFGGSDLGNTRGTYVDNIELGLGPGTGSDCFVQKLPSTEGGPGTGPAVSMRPCDFLQDTFSENESVPPADNAAFDTTSALIKTARNIVPYDVSSPPSGLVSGDSLLARCNMTGDGVTTGTEMDLVFRIDPGPGSYSVKGDRTSPLVEKDPAHPFWGAYEANSGAFGTGGTGPVSSGGNGGVVQGSIDGGIHPAGTRWNKDWFNSCRMDTAQANLWPILSLGVGLPVRNRWMGTIHELDPKFATLGINHLTCFVSDPAAPVSSLNTDCGDGNVSNPTPTTGYQALTRTNWTDALINAVAIRKEGTKILPDGYFSPGTHIEYFVRSDKIEDPTSYTLFHDTTSVFPQGVGVSQSQDQERFAHVDVLPDMWKSTRFGGAGLACLLLVDAADRRGSNPALRGMADTLGYGKTNGASQGWKVVDPSQPTDAMQATGRGPNNPAGFVAANLGQYGLNFDQFDVGGSESYQAGRLGNRLVVEPPGLGFKAPKQGPSPAMLAAFYSHVIYSSGDLSASTLHDGQRPLEPANDVSLLTGFLDGASSGNARMLWMSGDGLMEDASNGGPALNFMNGHLGADLASSNYRTYSGNAPPAFPLASTVKVIPKASWGPTGAYFGLTNPTYASDDVLQLFPNTSSTEAAEYDNVGPPPYTASIQRDWSPPTRYFRTILDGFDFRSLRGIQDNSQFVSYFSMNELGRLVWFDGVMTVYAGLCARRGPVVGVGDLPGGGAAGYVLAAFAARPNPAPPGMEVAIHYTLDRPRGVDFVVYTVSGRRVAHMGVQGTAGQNVLSWDRKDVAGAQLPAGVYFYSMTADGTVIPAQHKKVVLLGP